MQKTLSYGRVLAIAGMLGALTATACTVTTSNGDDSQENFGGTGNTTSTVTGGTGGTAGTASTLEGGNGGTAPIAFQCDPADGSTAAATPAIVDGTDTNACTSCTATHCATEYGACYATDPGNQCGYGGPLGDGTGEFACIQDCVTAATSDGGVVDSDTLGTCVSSCRTPKDSSGATCGTTIGSQTNDLVGCVNTNCQTDCFGGG